MTYQTLDSGERAQFPSGMVRDTDAGKARFDLILAAGVPYGEQMLTRFADLMTRGAVKYGDRNWEQADSLAEVDRMRASAFRHCIQWLCGELDEDHAAAVMFNITAAEATGRKLAQRAVEGIERHAERKSVLECHWDVKQGSDGYRWQEAK